MAELANNTDAFKSMIDPVCGMKVSPGKKSLFTSYRGTLYYFCTEDCRKAFGKNPHQYLECETSKLKGWWRRYLEGLNRCTGGKPIKCH